MKSKEKIPVDRKQVFVVLAIALLLSIFTLICYAHFEEHTVDQFFNYAIAVFQLFFTIAFAYLGVEVFRNRESSNPYYPECYGEHELRKTIRLLLHKYDDDTFLKIYTEVEPLKTRTIGDTEQPISLYMKIACILNDCDFDFFKLWNDFNYFDASSEMTIGDKEYRFNLQKCIDIKIYEYYQKYYMPNEKTENPSYENSQGD